MSNVFAAMSLEDRVLLFVLNMIAFRNKQTCDSGGITFKTTHKEIQDEADKLTDKRLPPIEISTNTELREAFERLASYGFEWKNMNNGVTVYGKVLNGAYFSGDTIKVCLGLVFMPFYDQMWLHYRPEQ